MKFLLCKLISIIFLNLYIYIYIYIYGIKDIKYLPNIHIHKN